MSADGYDTNITDNGQAGNNKHSGGWPLSSLVLLEEVGEDVAREAPKRSKSRAA